MSELAPMEWDASSYTKDYHLLVECDVYGMIINKKELSKSQFYCSSLNLSKQCKKSLSVGAELKTGLEVAELRTLIQ